MKSLLDVTYKLSAAGAVISLLAMIACVVTQVYARFFLASAPSWTEELARIFFIYSVAFGAGIGVRDGAFVRLDLMRNVIGVRRYSMMQGIIHIVIALFALVAGAHSLKFISIGFEEKSPALELNMGYAFMSMTLLLLALAVFCLEQAWLEFRPSKTTEP